MIADEGMANAIRLVAVERGVDPRDFGLIAFGGAGPLHARAVASRLGIKRILVPPAPGLCSAFGALIAPARVDLVKTYYANSLTIDPAAMFAVIRELTADSIADLRRSVEVEEPTIECFASLRYLGQNFELEIEIPGGSGGSWDELLRAFAAEHARQYGFDLPGEPVEVVSLRVTARREEQPLDLRTELDPGRESRSRTVWLSREGAVECPVHRRSELEPGTALSGPMIIEEPDSTTIAFAGDEVVADPSGVPVLNVGEVE
jgi:N-methylhydantoinase A